MKSEEWVARHKKRIEEVAYQIYMTRQRYNQTDDRIGNFLRAIDIVTEENEIGTPYNRRWMI